MYVLGTWVSFADNHVLPSLQLTTGALVLAKNLVTARQLAQQFQTRTVSKTYLALVRGGAKSFPSKYGEIREALEINKEGRVSIGAACDAKFAATDWELIGSSVSRVEGVLFMLTRIDLSDKSTTVVAQTHPPHGLKASASRPSCTFVAWYALAFPPS